MKIFMISTPHQISVKLRGMKFALHVAGMGETIRAYRVLEGKLERKKQF
jgi:hypothetical protein